MKRRVLAAAAAAATALAVVPALPALAAASSTAALTAGQAVYPGADRSFTLRVTNTEAPVFGKAINAVRINFPVVEANVLLGSTAGSALGFTGTKTDLGTTQFLTYRGGTIPPGAFLDFTFPALVGAPSTRDLLGDFRVQTSADNFATNRTALPASNGGLSTKVQILEIVQAGLKPVAPTNADNSKGVTDRSGTAGQEITYEAEIRNHARTAVDVVAGLTSAGNTDTATPTTVTVPAGKTAKAGIPVQLGAASADRSTVFTATATKDGAAAPTKTDTFSVQSPATLTYSDLQPTRVRTGAGSARDFTANAAKTGTPALDFSRSTLSFGGNSADAQVGAFAGGSSQKLVTFTFANGLTGVDGEVDAAVATVAQDDNLAGYSLNGALGKILIDNVAPALAVNVALPTDRDGDRQVAAKNGDTVTVSGTIKNAGDLVATSLNVVLQPNKGAATTVPVTLTGTGDERTFTGSASPAWGEATSFFAKAEARDTAGNSGGSQSAATIVDNTLPVLTGEGIIVKNDMITVTFTDASGVAGGCDPAAWLLDGTPNRVREVRKANGEKCQGLDDGARVLLLSSPLAVDATPRVTYEQLVRPVSASLAKDGAGNDAVRGTVNTVSRLTPAAPRLIGLERREAAGSYRGAYLDGDDKRYYSNATGAEALRLTVGGIQQNYTVQVLRDGVEVKRQKFTAAPAPLAADYNGSVLVPVDAALLDGAAVYTVRFLSAGNLAGDLTPFTVVLDRVVPTFTAAKPVSAVDGSTVTVTFSEKIARGTDFADDWFVSETVTTENGTAKRTVNVNSVSGKDMLTRVLGVTLSDVTKYAGTDYVLQSPNGVRYEDRAGNALASTLKLAG